MWSCTLPLKKKLQQITLFCYGHGKKGRVGSWWLGSVLVHSQARAAQIALLLKKGVCPWGFIPLQDYNMHQAPSTSSQMVGGGLDAMGCTWEPPSKRNLLSGFSCSDDDFQWGSNTHCRFLKQRAREYRPLQLFRQPPPNPVMISVLYLHSPFKVFGNRDGWYFSRDVFGQHI